jgi:hypothetical protein
MGQWLMTGSQEAPLMRDVTESMAGRAAVLQLLPFSTRESPKVTPLRGGFPEPLARPGSARLWHASYVQTYLERDVRSVLQVRDLATFRRFLSLAASLHGRMLNKTDLAAPLGISVPTVGQWLSVLETTLQIALVPPFHRNLGKRIVKSPKLYLLDSGLLCHLLGIDSLAELRRSAYRGAVFEGFVAAEILKAQLHRGRRRELYYFRDQQGLEVDFLVPRSADAIELIEAKASATVTPRMAVPLRKLAHALDHLPGPPQVSMTLVHEPTRGSAPLHAVAPGVRAIPWPEWARSL